MLKNLTKKTVISVDLKTDGFSKTIGLMESIKPRAILFTTRFGIHTFLLRFPIDVLILDNKNRVVKTKNSLKPNRIFLWNPKFSLVIELPRKSILKSRTEIGDIVSYKVF